MSTIGFLWFALATDTTIAVFHLTLTTAFASTVLGVAMQVSFALLPLALPSLSRCCESCVRGCEP